MRSRYSNAEWGYVAPASAFLRIVGIVVVAMVIAAAAAVCVAVSLLAVTGADSSISARHASFTAAPVVGPPLASAAPDISAPASGGGLLEPEAANLSEMPKADPVVSAVAEPAHVEAGAVMEQALKKKRATKPKTHRAGTRWRGDRILQRAALMERLKPQ
jgi:hypothetical protein